MENIKIEIGELAIIHYQARKEVKRLKEERSKLYHYPDYDIGETWRMTSDAGSKKLTYEIYDASEKGRIARYKMTCLIKQLTKQNES